MVSQASLEALGSIIVNKTVEGRPGGRYYGGAEFADRIETLAIERAKALFGCGFANVQPHSGSQANQAVFLAVLKPGDTVLSMALDAGGHLSHGAAPNLTGKWFNPVRYGIDGDGFIDMDAVERLAREHRPKLIICGGSAYPRAIDFVHFRRIADSVGAVLLADMAHFAGLVAGGVHPSPLPHAHVTTATTYKNLRGARGGIVLTDDPALARKLDSAVFPGVQGSVILNAVAAKAVCLGEALKPSFKVYAGQVLTNARVLAGALMARGITVVSGGTDTPLLLADLRPLGLTGAAGLRQPGGRRPHLQQECRPRRHAAACGDIRPPFRLGCRNHPRLSRGRVPLHRRLDRRRAARHGGIRHARRGVRADRLRRGADSLPQLPHLSRPRCRRTGWRRDSSSHRPLNGLPPPHRSARARPSLTDARQAATAARRVCGAPAQAPAAGRLQ